MNQILGTFVLAHLLADYPLQPDRMAAAKRTPLRLLLHVSTHLVVLLLLMGTASTTLWSYALVLAAGHYGIDAMKNRLSIARPHWTIGLYLLDQGLHLCSIFAIVAWIEQTAPHVRLLLPRSWLVFGIAYLFATVVWHISERTFAHGHVGYRADLHRQRWWRMAVRSVLLTLLIWGVRFWFGARSEIAWLVLVYVVRPLFWPAFAIDVAVSLTTALFVDWAL